MPSIYSQMKGVKSAYVKELLRQKGCPCEKCKKEKKSND